MYSIYKVNFILQTTKSHKRGWGVALISLRFRRWIGVGGERYSLSALHPVMTRCGLCRRLVESQGRFALVWKISASPGFEPRTVQAVASHYTD